jgi:methionine biosynthesis protein MetW
VSKPRLLIFIVAYFAEQTIKRVVQRIPHSIVDEYDAEILIIDDCSKDQTFTKGLSVALDDETRIKTTVLYNPVNQGYGGNQKIGYYYAIENGFDFVALLHGDGQYAPEMLQTLVEPLRLGEADAVFGSRMINPKDALKGGMPLYKFVGNRILTTVQNILLRSKLSEFHSGYRAYSVSTLKALPFRRNSNDFHFDTEIIIQLLTAGKRIRELPIPTYYGDEICYVNGMKYAGNVVKASLQARLQSINLFYDIRFDCVPEESGTRYPSKLDFNSSHRRVLDMIPEGARVLDLGSGSGEVGAALKDQKNCFVVGCDIEPGPLCAKFDQFIHADLNAGLPKLNDEKFDYIIALDIIEHLSKPEVFLDELRAMSARSNAKVIITTANIGFILMRLLLLFGRFEYGKRGILDLTHTRLFTLATLKRAMNASEFTDIKIEGVVVPMPFVFGHSRFTNALIAVNDRLASMFPRLFGFQLLATATPRPTLETLLASAQRSADELTPAAVESINSKKAPAAASANQNVHPVQLEDAQRP